METIIYNPTPHMGRQIERIRRLRGMTQSDLGTILGITKQAVSKLEQTAQIDDEKRIKQIADALGVTEEGLKKSTEESIQYYTYNFYENSGVQASSIGAHHIEVLNAFPDNAMAFFEKLLAKEREKFEKVKNKKEKE
jgi:transcriptional regulator with XRE-family HTH domain